MCGFILFLISTLVAASTALSFVSSADRGLLLSTALVTSFSSPDLVGAGEDEFLLTECGNGRYDLNIVSHEKLAVCVGNSCPSPFNAQNTLCLLERRGVKKEVRISFRELSSSSSKEQQHRERRSSSVPHPEYSSYQQIVDRVRRLAADYPLLVSVDTLSPRTVEGRELLAATFSPPHSAISLPKQQIFVSGAMHAREWISAEVPVGAVLEGLVAVWHVSEAARKALEGTEWIVIPVLNPDGYEYSRSSSSSGVRLWRKNRNGVGVDLNRNFPSKWGRSDGSSGDPSSIVYRGPSAASEAETKAVLDLLKRRFKTPALGISYHSYGQVHLSAPGYARGVTTLTSNLSRTLFRKAATFAQQQDGNVFVRYGSDPAWALYPVSGEMCDHIHLAHNFVPCSTSELRPRGANPGFLLGREEILPTVAEQLLTLLYASRAITEQVRQSGTTGSWYKSTAADGASTVATDLTPLLPGKSAVDSDGDLLPDFFDPCALDKSRSSDWASLPSAVFPLLGEGAPRKFAASFRREQKRSGCLAPWRLDTASDDADYGAVLASTKTRSVAALQAATPTCIDTSRKDVSYFLSVPIFVEYWPSDLATAGKCSVGSSALKNPSAVLLGRPCAPSGLCSSKPCSPARTPFLTPELLLNRITIDIEAEEVFEGNMCRSHIRLKIPLSQKPSVLDDAYRSIVAALLRSGGDPRVPPGCASTPTSTFAASVRHISARHVVEKPRSSSEALGSAAVFFFSFAVLFCFV